MKVSIVGSGYVGVTTGAVLAYLGHEVSCVDSDDAKVQQYRTSRCPFSEPFLEELLALTRERCCFTASPKEAIAEADVVLISVGTPPLPDGNADLRFVFEAAKAIAEHLGSGFKVVVNKSTVPIGSGKLVHSLIRDAYAARTGAAPDASFCVASNPEFLRQGSAVRDCFYPERILIGSNDSRAIAALTRLYTPIIQQSFVPPSFLPRPNDKTSVPLICTDPVSAELSKYAANAFLALKVSFINEIAELAERVGADVKQISEFLGLDPRIGPSFLQAGIGWGGSCLGKDTAALIAAASSHGLSMHVVEAAREVNYRQRQRVVEKLLSELQILAGRTVGVLGLAFKPHTDDIRDAPALDIARQLVTAGVTVKAHDPVALARARAEHSVPGLLYCDTVQATAQGCDAIVLVTEWPQYRDLPWTELAEAMRSPVMIDGRNFLDPRQLERAGFRYIGMGRHSNPPCPPRPLGLR